MNSQRLGLGWMVGMGALALYLYSMGPTLVPYRDAGEMTTSVATLGILHPTSYPLYSVLGHLFSKIPLANVGYRMNLFSAAAMAAAWGLLFIYLSNYWGKGAALLTVAMGLGSYQFWAHSLVSEMYTLNLLFAAAILVTLQKKQFLLGAFLLGLGVANRSDLVLSTPAFLVFGWLPKEYRAPRSLVRLLPFFILGFALYLYLPLRANQRPLLNWNDPSTLDQFLGSLLRRGYGGTLDLLSKSYGAGENFAAEFLLYLRHLWIDFAYIGIPLAIAGVIHLWRTQRRVAWGVLLGFGVTGPLFIFLGNLPPNPHAVAIMESAYLVPDLFFLLAVAAGISFLFKRIPLGLQAALSAGCLALLIFCGLKTFRQVDKRHNFLAADFIRNVYRSLPPRSLIVARSDVPIFSLFYGHWIYPAPAERIPLAQGLVASPWYQRMMSEQAQDIQLIELKTAAEWTSASRMNPNVRWFATQDIDWPSESSDNFYPWGLVNALGNAGSKEASNILLRDIYVYRGAYRYDAYRDFFSSELVEEYAKSWLTLGQESVQRKDWPAATEAYLHTLSLKPDLPQAAFQLGYVAFVQNHFEPAARYYAWAVDSFKRINTQAEEWKSFHDVRAMLLRDQAQAMAHWGVTEEHLGYPDRAKELYEEALQVDSNSADAHYNLAVLYWKQAAWPQVVDHLQAIAQAHPEDARWKQYLPAAMQHLRTGK